HVRQRLAGLPPRRALREAAPRAEGGAGSLERRRPGEDLRRHRREILRAEVAEAEFGVPVPGRVLPGDQWTKTGYRDPGKPFDWDAVFGRTAPRVVDLGCGNGRYLIGSALARPDRDHLGVDLVQVAIDHAAHRGNQRGLRNVRFVTGDANLWLFERLAPDSVDEIHIYHPQPYYEVADITKRLLTAGFLERTWTVLRKSGLL